MTLNPPLDNSGVPMTIPYENILLSRPFIQFQVKVDNLGKKQLKGTAYLTTHRIIFVSSSPTPDFQSFDIPLSLMYGQTCQFPFFGNTYLRGSCAPTQNLLPGHCHFKLWFLKGGCDGFIRATDHWIKQVRRYNNNMQQYVEMSRSYCDVRSGKFNHNAFVDPNDPSRVFVQQ